MRFSLSLGAPLRLLTHTIYAHTHIFIDIMYDLSGKTAVVTGAAMGMGRSLALLLVRGRIMSLASIVFFLRFNASFRLYL